MFVFFSWNSTNETRDPIRVMTKLPNSEQSYKGNVKTVGSFWKKITIKIYKEDKKMNHQTLLKDIYSTCKNRKNTF
jgi:hypothetical protein